MKRWIRALRIGAVFCLLPTMFLVRLALPSTMRGDYTVQRKYQESGQFRISAIGGGEIDAPYSKWFYANAEPGDDLHFGFHNITLRRAGRLVAVEIPLDTRLDCLWIALALFPLLAFLPDNRMPKRRAFLSLLTVAEIFTLTAFVAALFIPA